MKKIAMFTIGTRGDVQPYIILSRALMNSGFDVILGSHPCWRSLIESYGVHFEPVGPDIDIEAEAAAIRGKSSNAAFSMIRCMNFIMKMIPEKNKPVSFKDRLIGKMIGKQIDKPFNKIRKQYGLGPMKNGDELRSDKLNLIPISKYVVERSPYWEDKNILTGYWYDEEPEYIPDGKLAEFIKEGEKPVILALGAMSFEDKADKAKLDMFVNAFQKTGCRAVIQGFQKTLQDYDLPDTMIACGSVPHSWLFRQGSFVIHHCGFGTTAASMIYGIPSIPVPHVLDQLGFAMQLEKCGVATTHIDAKDLSEERLVKAIEEMKKDYRLRKHNAEEISEKIRTEGGINEAVRQIIRITGEPIA